MMNKHLTSILLVSGTCIGAGMIALPMSLAKVGIITSVILMFLIWLYSYYTSLVIVELNLQTEEKNLSLEELCRKYSGKTAEIIGNLCVKLLCYSLIAAYIYGGSSIIQNLFSLNTNIIYIQTCLAFATILVLQTNKDYISNLNGHFFLSFIGLLFFLIILLFIKVDYNNIPALHSTSFSKISTIIVVCFTSFGYQICSPALIKHSNNDIKILKNAFLYGSFIPLVVYSCWTFVILSVLYNNDIGFYENIICDNVTVGSLVNKLSQVLSFNNLNIIVWLISIFAIFTSLIGVSLGLTESYNNVFKEKGIKKYNLLSTLISIIPSYIITVLIPDAFIKILEYAGIISVIMAILLPIYLYLKADIKSQYIKILNKPTLIFCFILGIVMILLCFM